MRILGVERDTSACNQYRIIQPLNKLRQHGLADILTIHESELGSEFALEKVLESDILVFQRPMSEEWFKFIKICQKHGKIIVTDYDDDPFNTHPLNPYYKFIGTKEWQYKWPNGEVDLLWQDGVDGFSIERNIMRQDLFNSAFRKADMVTTTTDILAGFFKTLNNNTVALPNLVDFDVYQKYEMKKTDEVRIGYQCGHSHYEDIYVVRDAIKEVIRRNDNVKFVYFGDSNFRGLFQEIPTGRIEYHGWCQYIAYPYKLALMNLDIGICPLVDNVFNRNKSAIKYFEYSAMGAATVASGIPPYSPVINNEVDGILVNDEKQWIEALDSLVKDKSKRINMANKAYSNIFENFNADTKAHLWKDAYESLLMVEVA